MTPTPPTRVRRRERPLRAGVERAIHLRHDPNPEGSGTAAEPRGPLRQVRGLFTVDLAGASAAPLWVLFGLNLVDEFDRIAFSALTPEIRDTFGLSDSGIVAIGSIAAVFVLLAALPLGYLGDRFQRVHVASGSAIAWGCMAVLTGIAWAVPLLFLARLFSGVARTSTEVVHPSLLADYYAPRVHPQAFKVHRLANPLSAGAGILAGAIGLLLGWRWAFVILSIPTFVLVLGTLRLREPRRGESVNSRDAVEPDAPHVGFREARRRLFRVRTLRRTWAGGFFLGVALIAYAQLLSLFFEDTFGFGPFQRGVIQFLVGAGTVVGILVGARAGSVAAASGDFGRLAHVTAGSFLVCAAALLGLAVTPWAPVAGIMPFFLGIGLGAYQPVFYPLVARIVDPLVRSQAYGWSLVCVGLGAMLAIPLARFGEQQSYRGAFAILGVLIALGALIIGSARPLVAGDISRADAALTAAQDHLRTS